MMISDLNRAIKYKIVTASITRYVGSVTKITVESASRKISENIVDSIFGITHENVLNSLSGYFFIIADETNESFTISSLDILQNGTPRFFWVVENYEEFSIYQKNQIYMIDILYDSKNQQILEIIKFHMP